MGESSGKVLSSAKKVFYTTPFQPLVYLLPESWQTPQMLNRYMKWLTIER